MGNKGRSIEDIDNVNDIFVIGIGASAGGLESLRKLLINMPPKDNLAFVVVQHLSPNYKSFMGSILTGYTAMKVIEAEEGMLIRPRHVYLIPPQKNMTIVEGSLHLEEQPSSRTLNLPIDIFFRSLAADKEEKGIGIILSGAGTDGTHGCSAIKDAGGMVIIQDELTAQFDSMPKSVRSTGLFDFILSPEKIPEVVLNYSGNTYTNGNSLDTKDILIQSQDFLDKIFASFYDHYGLDFALYKQSSVIRGIERRMRVSGFQNFGEYLQYVEANVEESNALYKNLLIGVTEFFRDEEAFAAIKEQALPEIFRPKSSTEPIRVWIVGCSTGEEVYSISILLHEYMEEHNTYRKIKIFATDINTDSLDYASQGVYPESIALHVSRERLDKYFSRSGNYYQINKMIRDNIIFSRHNITCDPPFSQIDLLCCRNLLIYMNSETQKKIASYFQFSVNTKNGFLFLGSSEPTNGLIDFFVPLNSKWKIYRRTKQFKRTPIMNDANLPVYLKQMYPKKVYAPARKLIREEIVNADEIRTKLIKDFVPPSIIINYDNEIVEVFGTANNFLAFPSGKANLNILKLTPEKLSIALGIAINKVRKEQVSVAYKEVRLDEAADSMIIDFTVKPFVINSSMDFILIVFDVPETAAALDYVKHYDLDLTARERIADLERELEETKQLLVASIEDVETSNEELQSANEELVAANEELQSTNEEMHSVNEELVTVNSQYVNKIDELTELNDDLNNFLSSTNIGTVFLDKNLRIRRFTATSTLEINLIESDIGRPINHISHNFNNIDFLQEALTVLQNQLPLTKQTDSSSGKRYILRFLPYLTSEETIDGVIITMVDISQLKETNDKLRRFSHAIEQASSMIIITDPQGRIEYVNPRFTEVTGYSAAEAVGQSLSFMQHSESLNYFDGKFWEEMNAGKNWRGETNSVKKSFQSFWEQVNISPVKDESGAIVNFIVMKEDITESKKMLEKVKKNEEKFRLLFDGVSHFAFIFGAEGEALGSIAEANDYICQVLGYTRAELKERSIYDLVMERNHPFLRELHQELALKNIVTFELEFCGKEGNQIPAEVIFQNIKLNEQTVIMAIALDLTVKKEAEAYRKKAETDEQLLIEAREYERLRSEFFSNLSHEFRTPLNVILGTLQLLKLYTCSLQDESLAKKLDIINQNCYRLLRMVNNLIDITKIDAGYFQAEMVNHNIVGIVRNITLSITDYVENKSLSLTFETDAENVCVYCNPDSMERIMLNLLSNAIKFTPPQGSIAVAIRYKNQEIAVSVKDTGTGIPQEKLDLIFERFVQIDKSLTRQHEGSGIGLSLVKSLVEMHRGRIEVKSTAGEGSEFILTFPVIMDCETDSEMGSSNKKAPLQDERIKRIDVEFSDIYSF